MANYSKLLSLINGVGRTIDFSNVSNVLELGGGGLQLDGSSAGNFVMKAAATIASPYTIVWPAAQAASSGYVLSNDGTGHLSWTSPSAGSVTSVALSLPSIFSVSGSPVTSSGTLSASLNNQSANFVWAGPATGSATAPTFRALVSADIPNNAANTSGTASNITASSNSTLTTLSALTTASSLASVGTITSGIWQGTPVGIAYGGTGQSSADAAFDALNPMTTAGDLIYEVSDGTAARLAIGSSGQVLTVVGGAPAWAAPAVSPSSITLTQNHILVGNASNLAADVAMSGEASIVASGAITLSNAAVIAKVLTGYSAAAGTVSASDSILSAIEKIDGNDQEKLPLAGGTMSGNIDMGGNEITSLPVPSANGEPLVYDQLGAVNGVATLDGSGKVPLSQLPSSVMEYKGAWDASTNTPTLADGTGVSGYVYRVSVAGTQDLGSGPITFYVGDFVIYNGTIWERSPLADGVVSVNGSTGAVTVNAINQLTGDVTAGPASQSQSKAATVAKIQGTVVSGTTGSGNVVFSASPTLTGTISAAAANFSGAISASNFSGSSSGTNTGDQTITLTGDVTGSGTGSFAATIAAAAVTLSKLASNSVDENKIVSSALSASGALSGGSGSKLAVNVDGSTIDISSNNLEVKAGGITETQINSSALSSTGALAGGSGTKLSVKVDDSTIAINGSDQVSIKDAGVSATQLASGAFDQLTIVGGAGSAASVARAPKVVTAEIAGEAMASATLQAVRYSLAADSGYVAGQMRLADDDASSADNFHVIGLCYPAGVLAQGDPVTVIEEGIINAPSHGFTIGAPLYLGAAGALSSTAPSAASSAIVKVGQVKDADNIWVEVEVIGIN